MSVNIGISLLQLAVNVIELFVWFFLISVFLYFKENHKKKIACFLAVYLILYIVERIFPQILLFNLAVSIYSRFVIYILYRGKLLHKFFAFWISNCLNYVLDMFIISIVSTGFDGNLFFSSMQEMNSKLIVTLTKLLLIALICVLFKRLVSPSTLKIEIMSNSHTLLLAMLPIFGYVTMCVLDYGVRTYIKVPFSVNLFLIITYLATIIYNIVVMVLIDKLVLNRRYKLMNDISQEQLLIQFNHYESLKEKIEQNKKLKHDMKNHMLCIEALISNNALEEAKKLLSSIEGIMQESDLEISSGNSIVDAILNEKSKLAKQHGIRFLFEGVLPQDSFISPIDISTIFSNALDNAIEAAQQDDNSNRFVETTIKIRGKCLLILIENSVKQDISIKDNTIETTKDNKGKHGFGLRNIRDSVEKYGGDFNISCRDKSFTLEIMLSISA